VKCRKGWSEKSRVQEGKSKHYIILDEAMRGYQFKGDKG
jgi:hypothetical protein